MPTAPPAAAGRIRHGLAQSLAIWAVAVATIAAARDPAVAWAAAIAGLVAVLLLGNLHKRRLRAETAVGAYTGAVLWPLLLGLTLIAVNIASMSRSSFE